MVDSKRQRSGEKHSEVYKYKCRYCGVEFKNSPRFSPPSGPYGGEAKHGGCSDQVRCPVCKNFLATWNDVIKK